MKQTPICLFLAASISLSACNNNTQGNEAKPDSTSVITPVTDASTAPANEQQCYALTTADTVRLNLMRNGDAVTGNLYIHRSGKDINNGTIEGTMRGDTLVALYRFESEGVASTRQVAFLKKGENMVEGYGPVSEQTGGTMFTNLTELKFMDNTPLAKTNCSQSQ